MNLLLKTRKKSALKKQKSSLGFKILYCLMLVVMSVWVVILLYALFWILVSSLKDNYDYFFRKFGFPDFKMIAWENYARAFANLNVTLYSSSGIKKVYFETLLFNTLYVTLVSAFLSVFVPAIVGYVAAKHDFWFNKVLHAVVVFSMVVPVSGSLSGTLQIMQIFGIYDNFFFGTIVMRWGFLGTNFLFMNSAFKGIPNDYRDAARIDGAGHFTVLFRIMFPMIKNVFMMFFLLQLIAWWNTWDFTLIYMPSHPNLAQAVYNIQFSSEPDLTMKPVQMATCVIVIIPAFVLFMCFRNQIMQQVSFGGLKG